MIANFLFASNCAILQNRKQTKLAKGGELWIHHTIINIQETCRRKRPRALLL